MYFTDVGDEYAATADTYVINVNDVEVMDKNLL